MDPKNIDIKVLFQQLITHPALVQALQPPSLQELPIVQPQPPSLQELPIVQPQPPSLQELPIVRPQPPSLQELPIVRPQPPSLQELPIIQPQRQAIVANTTSRVQPQPNLSEQRQAVPSVRNVEPQLKSKPLAKHPLNSKDIFANIWQGPSLSGTSSGTSSIKSFKSKSKRDETFSRKVVLVKPSNFDLKIPSESESRKRKLVEDNFPIKKKWSESKLLEKLQILFKAKLAKTSTIKFMCRCGSKLSNFKMQPDTEIDGHFLQKNTRTTIYIQECTNVLADAAASSSDEERNFKPKKRTKQAENEQNIICEGGRTYYVDENGRKHELVDVTDNAFTILSMCKPSSVSRKARTIVVKRAQVLDDLMEIMSDETFSLKDEITVNFANEFGVDTGGLLKEMLDISLHQMKQSPFLEGDDFQKTFKLSGEGLKKKIYETYGAIIALSLINGGPSPAFFSETFINATFKAEECFDVPMKDVLNPHVRNDLENVLAAKTFTDVNELMGQSQIFTYAGTYELVKEDDFEALRDLAVEEAKRFYAVTRIEAPLAQFRKGLDKEFNLFTKLKTLPISELKKLFHEERTELTATTVENLFHIDSMYANHPTYTMWKNYLKYVEGGDSRVNLAQVLKFVTGLSAVPPLGFPTNKRPTIELRSSERVSSSTCFNTLYLPRFEISEEVLFVALDTAIHFGDAFGSA